MIDLSLPAPELAPRLLGCHLCIGNLDAIIGETEAYQGSEDLACHASKGRTKRTEVLFWAPGHWYCYLCYGIHVLVNVVCHQQGVPAAVLLRGVRLGDDHLPGPGILSKRLGITLDDHGTLVGERITLTPGQAPEAIETGVRVGVAYAGPNWANRPWRFWVAGFPAKRQIAYGL
jgi:DNA-3-methyladenine glycosylase